MLLHETHLGKAILSDTATSEELVQAIFKFYTDGLDFGMRDSVTNETFVHLVVSKPEVYSRPDRVGILYMLSCKTIDLDAKDHTGETALHKVVRYKGVHRMITCLMRCGTDPGVKNKTGKTAEDLLRTDQPEGWEENLHWLMKFLPGLFQAVLTGAPDLQLVERLLKSWCRLCKVVNGQTIMLKCAASKRACSLSIIMLLEKYENTIELALAALAGKSCIIQNWKKDDIMKNMDVNAKDCSYQYGYPDYPISPKPLLASVWETNNYEMVAELMTLEPDSGVPYRFEPEAHHTAKPLFFFLIDPKMRPADERIIRRVLQDSNLCARNTLGQTVLFEAVLHEVSEALFSFMLHQGCDVAERDRFGRTARGYAEELGGRERYVVLIDEHVYSLVVDCNINRLESLILRSYDHVTGLEVVRKRMQGDKSSKYSKQLEELLSDVNKKQEHARKMFQAAKNGCTSTLKKLLTKKYVTAQDRGGRTALHHAVEKGHRNVVEQIANEYPQIINIPNNMGQTPLHYAHLFMHFDDTVAFLVSKGACVDIKDVEGWTPSDYVQSTIGSHAHELMQQRVRDLELDLFLSVTNFDVAFLQAIRDGNLKHVEALAIRLRDHGGMRRFNMALFECLDNEHEDIACVLIKLGFNTDVYKQYEMCQPDNPMCAMIECSHSTTAFKQRAEQVQAQKVLKLMDDIANGKVKLKDRRCCLGRCLRPSLPATCNTTPTSAR